MASSGSSLAPHAGGADAGADDAAGASFKHAEHQKNKRESRRGGAAPEVVDGYALSAAGLGAMVKDNQLAFVGAYGGGDGLAARLGSDAQAGLPKGFDYEARRKELGRNYVELPPLTPYWRLILEGLHDVTMLMLLASAAVSLVLGLAFPGGAGGEGDSGNSTSTSADAGRLRELSGSDNSGEWIEGAAILATVALVLNVQAGTDWSKARAFRRQQQELEGKRLVACVRGGESVKVHPRELVVGDVLRVQVGDVLAADCVLLQGSDVSVDESALTGESEVVRKQAAGDALAGRGKRASGKRAHGGVAMPFLLSGTSITNGSGKALVAAVGTNSLQGRILLLAGAGADAEDKKDKEAASKKAEEQAEQHEGLERDSKGCGLLCLKFGGGSGGTMVEKLDQMAIDIGKIGLTVALIVFVVLVARWAASAFGGADAQGWQGVASARELLEFFITSITILVVAIPEGLPLAVTLALAVSISRMTRDNNQVKNLDSCETMGSATTICSDKTGTLTENRMGVVRIVLGGQLFSADAAQGRSCGDAVLAGGVSRAQLALLGDAIALNSSPQSKVTRPKAAGGAWTYEGNPTECALLQLAVVLGADPAAVRAANKVSGSALDWGVFALPFSSSRKKMTSVVRIPGGFRVLSKGAPSYVLDSCAGLAAGSAARAEVDAHLDSFANAAMRTLAVAYRDYPEPGMSDWAALEASGAPLVEQGLTLLCVVGIEDPLRPSVVRAIKQCNQAGVDVRMCTGDALTTAVAISKQCGILRQRDLLASGQPKQDFAMTGAEFDERVHMLDLKAAPIKRRTFDPATRETCEALRPPFVLDELSGNKIINQAAFDAIWPKLRVLARCQPEDKLALVRGMRASELFRDRAACERLRAEHGIRIFPDYQVVAVTGDGTNDAPALRSADVGFAMGITGTDIAKQACDIMLLDDNFASTVLAVKWGRNVYDSISKFIQFQLTVNVTAISIASVGAFVYDKTPLSAVQMLWVNLIMDSLASLALATERPSDALLDRAPYGKRRPLISKVMIFNILGHSVYQLAVLFAMLFLSPSWMPHGRNGEPVSEYPPAKLGEAGDLTKWTIVFNTFVQMQLFNQFNARRLCTPERLRTRLSEWNILGGISGNPLFIIIALLEFALQVVIVQYGGAAFKIIEGGLSPMQWALCVALGAFAIPWQFVIQVALLASEGRAQRGSDPRVQVADDDVEIATKGSGPDTKTRNRTASAASRRRSRRDSGTAQAMRHIANSNLGASTTSI